MNKRDNRQTYTWQYVSFFFDTRANIRIIDNLGIPEILRKFYRIINVTLALSAGTAFGFDKTDTEGQYQPVDLPEVYSEQCKSRGFFGVFIAKMKKQLIPTEQECKQAAFDQFKRNSLDQPHEIKSISDAEYRLGLQSLSNSVSSTPIDSKIRLFRKRSNNREGTKESELDTAKGFWSITGDD